MNVGPRKRIWSEQEAVQNLPTTMQRHQITELVFKEDNLPQGEDYNSAVGYPNSVRFGESVIGSLQPSTPDE